MLDQGKCSVKQQLKHGCLINIILKLKPNHRLLGRKRTLCQLKPGQVAFLFLFSSVHQLPSSLGSINVSFPCHIQCSPGARVHGSKKLKETKIVPHSFKKLGDEAASSRFTLFLFRVAVFRNTWSTCGHRDKSALWTEQMRELRL